MLGVLPEISREHAFLDRAAVEINPQKMSGLSLQENRGLIPVVYLIERAVLGSQCSGG